MRQKLDKPLSDVALNWLSKPHTGQYMRQHPGHLAWQVTIQIRGEVQLEDGTVCRIPDWVTVSQIDDTLDLLGLGDGTELEDDERLLWVFPLSGEIRLSELEEEN